MPPALPVLTVAAWAVLRATLGVLPLKPGLATHRARAGRLMGGRAAKASAVVCGAGYLTTARGEGLGSAGPMARSATVGKGPYLLSGPGDSFGLD